MTGGLEGENSEPFPPVVSRLPLVLALHQPLLAAAAVAPLQPRVAGAGRLARQAPPRVDVFQRLLLLVVDPGLVAAHAVAPDQLHWGVGAGRVQAVVVGHHLQHKEISHFWKTLKIV